MKLSVMIKLAGGGFMTAALLGIILFGYDIVEVLVLTSLVAGLYLTARILEK